MLSCVGEFDRECVVGLCLSLAAALFGERAYQRCFVFLLVLSLGTRSCRSFGCVFVSIEWIAAFSTSD